MARRSDHNREELQQIILDTAGDIVREQGYQALTARRIAREIGYTPGTLYNVFESMDDMCLHLNAQTIDALYTVLADDKSYNPKEGLADTMKRMARLYQEFAREHRNEWLMLFTHSLPDDVPVPVWYQEKVARLFLPLEKLIESFPSFSSGYPPQATARTLWAAVHGIVLLENTKKLDVVTDGGKAMDMTGLLIDNFIQ